MNLRDKLKFWMALSNYVDMIVRGTSPLSLPDAIANSLSYVKAFGGTEQRNIPQPYTQVNYVTNTAQTAVNTGIRIDFAKNYEFEVECRAVGNSWYILQSRASSSAPITGIAGSTTGNTITLVIGGANVCVSAIARTVGNKLYIKATLNNGTATLYVKDETAGTEDTQTGSYSTSQTNPTAAVYLLGNGGGQYVDINSDIYMARIKENDTVVMDYVPCRQAATAGFYDTVSGTFKTAETPANLSAGGNAVPTPDTPMDIVSNNGVLKVDNQGNVYADGTVETIKDSLNNTATAEMLLKVGDYQDTQSVIDGVVTRNVGVKVFDGTETFISGTNGWLSEDAITDQLIESYIPYCTHFNGTNTTPTANSNTVRVYHTSGGTPRVYFGLDKTIYTSAAVFKQWLANQYAAGTPVIVVYPLATPTTESVAGQTLQVTDGDNVLEITQASLNNLELESKYQKEA